MDLSVTIVQTKLFWHDRNRNLEALTIKLNEHPGQTDLIVLPEMFSTGFSMQAEEFAETMNGQAMQWMREMAASKHAVVTGSLMMQDAGKYTNRLIWMFPDGNFQQYDKRHLFRMANENQHYSSGSERLIVYYKGWKICPLICYDLRFPVFSRNRCVSGNYDYDCLIYVANWPEKRALAWRTLIHARAIENQAYVVAVNRIGTDGNEVIYSGDSAVIDYKGEMMSKTGRFGDRCETVALSRDDLTAYREIFPAAMDADKFTLEL